MTDYEREEEVDLLLVEDNPGDIKLTEKAFENASLRNDLRVVTDGVEAMRYLRDEGEYADDPRPDLVLLDLNLPKKDGTTVLEEIKDDDDLKRIPVVILTSSEAEEDIVKTYDLHANAYLTKPVTFDGFKDVVRQIEGFWFKVVRFPST
ncbi:Response regulator receiver domain-containing protein [Natronoarchaeum philippinense]|uniref:Response regulator receiver domain-containing protein n=1 Tax=Natronoarchaeum philippinense TaxID=558529 RepID=A0A285NW23_NATPI|nr:response regulator [Natronoarchaeum philippinense]SNZ13237.1 Response regulator receiver domain-containing protein [Natronoarchaeum philippinense]